MSNFCRFARKAIWLLAIVSRVLPVPAHGTDQHWLRVSSDHFIVITDASEKAGHDVAARFEQMRAIFGQLLMRSKLRMSEPMEIIAIRGDKDYAQIAPLANGQPTKIPGFWITSEG